MNGKMIKGLEAADGWGTRGRRPRPARTWQRESSLEQEGLRLDRRWAALGPGLPVEEP